MAIEVELPDGSIAEFPDGTDPGLIKSALQKRFAPPKPDFGNVLTQTSQIGDQTVRGPLAESSSGYMGDVPSIEQVNAQNRAYMASPQRQNDQQAFDQRQAEIKKQDFAALPAPARFAIGAGSRVGSAGRGLGQLVAGAQDAISPQQQDIRSLISGQPTSRYDQAMAAENAARQNDQFMEGDLAAGAGKVAGEVGLTALPMSKVGGATTLARAGRAGLAGAAYGGLQPVVDGESRGGNAALGGLLNMGGQVIGEGLLKSGQQAAKAVAPELRKAYEYAKAQGINLTPAQLSDSQFLKRLVGMADKLPFSGAAARNAEQQAAGNRALAKLVGEDSPVLDQTTLGRAADNLGKKFDQVFENGTRFDEKFARKLAELKQTADETMDDTARRTIDSLISRLKEQADNWHIPGQTLKSLDQAARKAATGGGDRQQVAQAFREELHKTFGRNAGEAVKKEWSTIRKQYADLKTLEPLVARNPEGGVPMQQVLGAVNSNGRGRTLMARGKAGEIGELAKIGQRMKGPSSSGTAENLQAGGIGAGLLGAPLQTLGLLGAGAIGGRALNSGLLSKFLMRENAGATRQALAPLVRAGLLAAPAASEKKKSAKK